MDTKICSRCKVEKPINDFPLHKSLKSGRNSWCKACKNIASSNLNYPMETTGHKICNRCKQDLDITEFHKDRREKDGRRSYCKHCNRAYKKNTFEAMLIGNKQCSVCGEIKPIIEFPKNRYSKDGRGAGCKHCDYLRGKNSRYNKQYGISLDEYSVWYRKQGGKCSICERVQNILVVDHHHKTGKVRGLLCSNCNTGIGLLQDDSNIMQKATNYIRSFEC
jgi:hypothetical protein